MRELHARVVLEYWHWGAGTCLLWRITLSHPLSASQRLFEQFAVRLRGSQ
jgi:hypothetical protein